MPKRNSTRDYEEVKEAAKLLLRAREMEQRGRPGEARRLRKQARALLDMMNSDQE